MDKYTVTVYHLFEKNGEEIDLNVDSYHDEYEFDSANDACAEFEKYHIGDVIGEYSDGTEVVVSGVELCDETGILRKRGD